LYDGNSVIKGTTNLLLHATTFYKNLFGHAQGNLFPLDLALWHEGEIITEKDNTWLTRSFSEEEIKEALFKMESNKAVGPDNIPVEFYQSCWSIVKEDLVELFAEFHNGGLDVS
jgi:hypothetical protein